LAALAVAGLPTDRFFFAGFLPPKQAARRARIAELAGIPATIVLFETGPRVAATLADLAAGLGRREAALCRELTKLHEEVRRGDLEALAQGCEAGEVRGEIVLVIASAEAVRQPSVEQSERLLREALTRTSLKNAVAEVASATGLPRRELYQRALVLAKRSGEATNEETGDGAPR
jgi:16S rRNA (cytidine1402-2'-O)-methyltransferase